MKSFVEYAAAGLHARFGDTVSDLKIVFPNKRARLFFNEALSRQIASPLWQPSYISIDDLVKEASGLVLADNLRLVAELYKIYCEYHPEPFDKFYQWGLMLLADFDTVDKYMIDAGSLYSNISDLKEIEACFGEQEEAAELVRDFWRTFDRARVVSEEQKTFLKIWQSLGEIYWRFNLALREQGIAYSGMIYRDVAERLAGAGGEAEIFGSGRFCFLGFNALNECEKRIFRYMKEHAGALFLWDYDDYYLRNSGQEAGRFLRRNIPAYGESIAIPSDNFAAPKSVEVVSSPSDIMQCKALYDELAGIYAEQGFVDKETAVVLTDENLLIPVLHSIPPEIDRINVTMGYPVTGTVPYMLLERLLQLQERCRDNGFYHSDVEGLLSHPYIAERKIPLAASILSDITSEGLIYVDRDRFAGNEFLRSVFRPAGQPAAMRQYLTEILEECSVAMEGTPDEGREMRERREFLYIIITAILKLHSSVEQSSLSLTAAVYGSLLRQMLRGQRVPYEGEPLGGLQIMGILETRNIDFKNIIFLSVGDDTFPGNRSVSSYIPFNLRQAFGMPTIADHEAMYAYYFYRAVQRCGRLVMMYNSAAEGQRSGEPSRYIRQLEYESRHDVVTRSISLRIESSPPQAIVVTKDGGILARLAGASFSPSQLNRYIDCPLRFYFADVERISPVRKPDEGITRLDVGNLMHKALEMVYRPLVGAPDPRPRLQQIVSERKLFGGIVDAALAELLPAKASDENYAGQADMIKNIVLHMASRIVAFDAAQTAPFTVAASEAGIAVSMELGGRTVRLRGVIDRLDRLPNGRVRIVDYKSGKSDEAVFGEPESLFTDNQADGDTPVFRKHNSAVLQTLVYSLMLTDSRSTVYADDEPLNMDAPAGVVPALYVVPMMNRPDYDPRLRQVLKRDAGKEEFAVDPLDGDLAAAIGDNLAALFGEILDPAVEFAQTPFADKCKYCDFKTICRR